MEEQWVLEVKRKELSKLVNGVTKIYKTKQCQNE